MDPVHVIALKKESNKSVSAVVAGILMNSQEFFGEKKESEDLDVLHVAERAIMDEIKLRKSEQHKINATRRTQNLIQGAMKAAKGAKSATEGFVEGAGVTTGIAVRPISFFTRHFTKGFRKGVTGDIKV